MSLYSRDALVKSLRDLLSLPGDKLDSLITESEEKQIPLEELLISGNYVSDADMGKLIADLLSLPYIHLSEQIIESEVLNAIPEIVAKKQKVIAFAKTKDGLSVATANPENTQIFSFISKKTGLPIKVYYATSSDINDAMSLYSKDVKKAYDDIIAESVHAASQSQKEVSIVKIVDTTVVYANQNKASDIHIEPQGGKCRVRFRIDGVLHDVVELPKTIHEQIVNRVKVSAKLRTDEHLAPQDGKISFKLDGENLDIRVSIVPVSDGEKVVMRLLSENSREFSLKDLGLIGEDLVKVEKAFNKPHGMILATGPTGSGKTTTLYAILKILNTRDVNIMTIEDPVEYDIEGVNQIQVNEKTGLTFATGLRSIVRQDPNIVLVGEIRDSETADISVNAAMTGHLLLSTLHTNDAATAVPRLIDLGIEPFLVATTLNVIIAQRLVRKICSKCRYSVDLDLTQDLNVPINQDGNADSMPIELIKKYYPGASRIRIYRGKGCKVCHQTGYSGRVGIFEVMEATDKIKEAINEKRDAGVIQKIAQEEGMTSMFVDGIAKVNQGITTLEEILRVTRD